MRLAPAAALVVALAAPAAARELWTSGGETRLELVTSLKSTALLSRAPDDPALYPERDGSASFFRLRLEPRARPVAALTLGVAYEQQLWNQAASEGIAGLGVLPPTAPAPYRVRQIAGELAGSSAYAWRHELDRAFVGLHLGRAEITVGRQAIGWGRGVLFGAVDLFAPFSPLEADREWRRGVDAVRADVKLTSRLSVDGVAAFGESLDASVFAARLRGYLGDVDLELVGGWRAGDALAGATSSAAVGDAELHGELAVFVAEVPLPASGERVAVKAVAGGSYRFAVGNGLVVFLEYHHSGFGAAGARELVPLLADAAFRDRLQRGDTQILGRHAVAALASYEVSAELSLALLGLVSPVDGSGALSPSATATLGDRLSVVLSAVVPWGARPQGLELESEYGAAPLSALVQVRIYD